MAMKMTRYLLLLLVYIFSIHADEGDDLSTREVALSSESEPISLSINRVDLPSLSHSYHKDNNYRYCNTYIPPQCSFKIRCHRSKKENSLELPIKTSKRYQSDIQQELEINPASSGLLPPDKVLRLIYNTGQMSDEEAHRTIRDFVSETQRLRMN